MKRKRAIRLAPYRHARYSLANVLHREATDEHRAVWSYVTGHRREYHMDIWDGDRYIGHLTFTTRAPGPRGEDAHGD